MYIAFEIWNAKPAFLAASPEEREQIFAGVREGIAQMAAAGITPLGWGRIDPSEDHPSGYDWFAAWTIHSAELVEAFFAGVAAAGWYDWFEQINVSGELRPVAEVIDAHVALANEAS